MMQASDNLSSAQVAVLSGRMDATPARRAAVQALIEQRFGGRTADFARAIGRDDAQVWQFMNQRSIGEKLARDIEAKLSLPRGALDDGSLLDDATPRTGKPAGVYSKGVPVVGTAQLGDNGHHEELQYPVGHGDGFVAYPTRDRNAYALRVKGDSMRPRIKPGEFVVVEPAATPQPGDEVLVRTKDGKVMVKVLDFRRGGVVQLSSVNEDHRPITIEEENVERLHLVAAIVKAALYYKHLT